MAAGRLAGSGAATLLAVALASCSGGSGDGAPAGRSTSVDASARVTSAPGSATGDPCALMSRAELEAIIGPPIPKAEPVDAIGEPACVWYDGQDGDAFRLIMVTAAHYESGREPRPLTALGEEAYLAGHSSVFVKTAHGHFVAESYRPVADGKISDEIRRATADEFPDAPPKYEASYRVARLLVTRLARS
jgi:hypothetical protein